MRYGRYGMEHKIIEKITVDMYVKYPVLLSYIPGNNSIKESFLRKIEIFEILRVHPHSNICECYEYIKEEEFISGICLKKYKYNLREAMENKISFNKEKCINEISAAINHFHSLGIVHEDINPSNIMFDKNMKAILVDFDSCYRVGVEKTNKI